MREPSLAPFYLVGTALALHPVHRLSLDPDSFRDHRFDMITVAAAAL